MNLVRLEHIGLVRQCRRAETAPAARCSCFASCAIDAVELLRIVGAVVRRHVHAHEHDFRVSLAAPASMIVRRFASVVASGTPRNASLAPSSDDHDAGLQTLHERRQAGPPAACRVAADAGVGNAIIDSLFGRGRWRSNATQPVSRAGRIRRRCCRPIRRSPAWPLRAHSVRWLRWVPLAARTAQTRR